MAGAILLCMVGVVGFSYWIQVPGPLQESRVVEIERGASVSAIAQSLKDQGVISSSWAFMVATRLEGLLDKKLLPRAGEFLLPPHASPQAVIYTLAKGQVVQYPLTVIEGETVAQVMAKVRDHPKLAGEMTRQVPEGLLAPETYYFTKGTTRDALLDRLEAAQRSLLADLWGRRPDGCPLTSPEALLTLASIVEKETALPAERPLVAAVFLNRLALGMPLQADPTVVYGVTKGEGALGRSISRDDLNQENPYNTYKNRGLPPGPIALPSRSSLEAVLNPAAVDYLYFVANGRGGHVFATTLEEHKKNHQNWREIRGKI